MFLFRSKIKITLIFSIFFQMLIFASNEFNSSMFASNINSKIEKIDEYSCSDFEKDCMGVCGGHGERGEDGGCTVSNNRSDSYTYDEISYSWQSGNMTNWEGSDDAVQTFNLPFTFPYYGNNYTQSGTYTYLYSPNTTSQTTIKVYVKGDTNRTVYVNRWGSSSSKGGVSTMTLWEVAP